MRRFIFSLVLATAISGLAQDAPPANPARDFNQVYVRDSNAALDKFALAERMERLKEWGKAAEIYQDVLNASADRVVPVQSDANQRVTQYGSVAAAVQERLAKWPAEGLAAYRQRYDFEAQSLLDAAKPDDLAALHKVVAMYFVTDAARTAATRLIDARLEAGDFAAAQWTAERLLDWHPNLGDARPMLLYRGALAAHFAGDEDEAKKCVGELEKDFNNTSGHVRGQEVRLLDALRSDLAAPRPAPQEASSGEQWASAFGSVTNHRVPQTVGTVGAKLFSIELAPPEGTPLRSTPPLDPQVDADRLAGLMTGIFPIVDHGDLFFQDNAHVYAVNLESGLPLPRWTQTYSGVRGGRYGVVGAIPTPRGHACAITLSGDSLFAIMGMSDARTITNGGLAAVHESRLVRLDRESGRERWSVQPNQLAEPSAGKTIPPTGISAETSAAMRDLDFSGSPLVVDDNIYLLARGGKGGQFEDCYVVCLAAETGKLKWATYVASGNVGGQLFEEYGAVTPQSLSHLAFASGRVFCATNLGAVAALDACDGSVIWLNLYPRQAIDIPRRWIRTTDPSQQSRKPWTANPVIVDDGNVFVLPSDGANLHVYAARDGAEVRRIPLSLALDAQPADGAPPGAAPGDQPADQPAEQMNTLLGVINGRALLATDRTLLLFDWRTFDAANATATTTWLKTFVPARSDADAVTNKDDPNAALNPAANPNANDTLVVDPNRPRDPDNSTIRGRAFLSATQVFVSTPWNLQSVSLKSGSIQTPFPASGTWHDDEEPGNVLATSEHLIVAGPTRVTVYTDFNLALQRLDAAVAAAPNDPEPRLRYAEVMFVSGKKDVALAKVDEAIALLGGRAAMREGAARSRVFSDSITFAQKLAAGKNFSGDRALIDGWFDRATDAAQSPEEQVRVRLTRADFVQVAQDPADELRLSQEILVQPTWRSARVPGADGGVRPAGMIALANVEEILRRPENRILYAPFEKQASDALENARPAGDPAVLLEIARAYPSSAAGHEASLLAADAMESAGNSRQALAALRQIYARSALDAPDRARVLEAVARNELALPNHLDVAAARLAQGAKLSGDPRLTRPMRLPDGQLLQNVSFADALAAVRKLQAKQADGQLPDLHLPATGAAPFVAAAPIAGISMLCVPPRDAMRNDRVVVFSPTKGLEVFAIGASSPLFASNALAAAPRGVAWAGGNLFVWADDKLLMLDGDSGQPVWQVALADLPAVDDGTPGDSAADSQPTSDAPANDGNIAGNNGGKNGAVEVVGNGRNAPLGVVVRGNGRVIINGGNLRVQQLIPVRRPGGGVILQPAPAAPAVQNILQNAGDDRIVNAQALSDRAVFVTTRGRVGAVDLVEGKLLWQSQPIGQNVAIDKLMSNDDFVALKASDASSTSLVALDAGSGDVTFRRTFMRQPGTPIVPVNAALASDGTLVWVMPDRAAGKDLFEPGDALRFGDLRDAAESSPDGPYVSAYGDDQLAIVNGKILVIADQATQLRVLSLETGRVLRGSDGASDLRLATGAMGVESLPSFRALGSMVYIANRLPPRVSSYDLDHPKPVWDSGEALQDLLLQTILISRGELLAIAGERSDDDKHTITGFQIQAYSRALSESGQESGVLLHRVSVNDPTGLLTCQSVDGGLYYLSGDQQLHFLASNAK